MAQLHRDKYSDIPLYSKCILVTLISFVILISFGSCGVGMRVLCLCLRRYADLSVFCCMLGDICPAGTYGGEGSTSAAEATCTGTNMLGDNSVLCWLCVCLVRHFSV